jgi:plasmid maintenance system antidote protein VapI
MAMKKKVSTTRAAAAEREFQKHRKGAVDAVKFLEGLNGPLTFGRLMNSIRYCDGELSLATMAAKLGVSRTHLHDIEVGRRTVSAERAARWGKLLGYGPEQFVELALQAELDNAGIKLKVSVKAA